MRSRLSLILMTALFLCGGQLVLGQQSSEIHRIGILSNGNPKGGAGYRAAFRKGLQDLGYVEGKNIIIEYRHASRKRDRLLGLATELVKIGVDVIVPSGPTAVAPTMAATKTIPIVMPNGGNPLQNKFVSNLARPEGNVTGMSQIYKGLGFKNMELLKETFPWVSSVVVLNPLRAARIKEYKQGAQKLDIAFESVRVRRPKELETAFSTVTELKPQALIVMRGSLTLHSAPEIADFAIRKRLVTTGNLHPLVRHGGLMSYGFDYYAGWYRAATFVDKILKGAKPADLPIEPSPLKFLINLKTANKLGLKIPPEILLEASEIIK